LIDRNESKKQAIDSFITYNAEFDNFECHVKTNMDFLDAINQSWASVNQPKPKVIFLDVDGVLSNSKCLTLEIEPSKAIFTEDEEYPLEKRCLNLLHRLVESTGSKIVLSTTWRLEFDMRKHLLDAFEQTGGEAFRNSVIGDTPKLSIGRGFEIQQWLETNGASEFVIFEDSERHWLTMDAAGFSDQILKTKIQDEDPNLEGITEDLVSQAIQILGSE